MDEVIVNHWSVSISFFATVHTTIAVILEYYCEAQKCKGATFAN